MITNFLAKYSYIFIPLTLIIGFSFFILINSVPQISTQQTINPHPKKADTDINSVSSVANTPIITPDNTTTSNTGDIPILMYHHIRLFTDQNDRIGFNLSVSPSDFSQQLDLIQSYNYTTIGFNDLSGLLPAKPIILTFDDGYENFYTSAYPEIKKRNMKAVVYIIANKDSSDYLTSDQITELSKNNIEIGSHTMTHPDLRNLSQTRLSDEISNSKSKIESITQLPVLSFCYPAGKYDTKTIETVKNSGYTYAVTTNGGLANLKNPLELSRFRMNHGTNILKFIR